MAPARDRRRDAGRCRAGRDAARARARPPGAARAGRGRVPARVAAAGGKRGRARARRGGLFSVDLEAVRAAVRSDPLGRRRDRAAPLARLRSASSITEQRGGRALGRRRAAQHARRAVPAQRALRAAGAAAARGSRGQRGRRSRSSTSTRRAGCSRRACGSTGVRLDERGAWELAISATASGCGSADRRVDERLERFIALASPMVAKRARARSATSTCATPTASRRLERPFRTGASLRDRGCRRRDG